MSVNKIWTVSCFFLAIALGPASALAQDSKQGAMLYQQQCVGCHSVEPAVHLAGPSLWGIVGREVGSSEGVIYSTALKKAEIVWDSKTLFEFLGAPSEILPGTTKIISVPDERQRSDLVDYLQTLTN